MAEDHGMWRRVVWQISRDGSEKPAAYFLRVARHLIAQQYVNVSVRAQTYDLMYLFMI
jgi:hypothetical protein